MFNSDSLFDVGLHPSTLYPLVSPRPHSLFVGSNRIQKPPATPIPMGIHALVKAKEKQPNILQESNNPFITEEQEELLDALSPTYDRLVINKGWWILEILPFQVLQRGRGRDVNYFWYVPDVVLENIRSKLVFISTINFRPHLGASRTIPHQLDGFKVHRSVRLRMNAEFEDEHAREMGRRYVPKAEFHLEPTWVDWVYNVSMICTYHIRLTPDLFFYIHIYCNLGSLLYVTYDTTLNYLMYTS